MRLDGHGTLTLEYARTWIEETGLCLFLPKRQFSTSIAPSFVEAVAGKRDATPAREHIALAEELLVRLETDGVAVRLNLLGLPGEAPDFVVASWVLPYVYALRGDRDWRRSPQLTRALGREVTEGAVLRAITELWQQLRIIPVVSAPGQAAQWQLLRTRFQKAIAEGASTSQVTAISVLASIYLQAVIAASMEEVELFLAPLTARSKVREVLRGLVATRQVHTISLGHAPHFYVAGTLPEFATPPTIYASASIPASAYFLRSHEDEMPEPAVAKPAAPAATTPRRPVEAHTPRTPATRKPVVSGKAAAARPHFSRPAAHTRDRKPAQTSSSSRPARQTGLRTANGARPASAARWSSKTATPSNGKRNGSNNGNGSAHKVYANGARTAGKPGTATRAGNAPRKDSRPASRPAHAGSSRKPTVAAGTRTGSSKRFGYSARPKQGTKKRG